MFLSQGVLTYALSSLHLNAVLDSLGDSGCSSSANVGLEGKAAPMLSWREKQRQCWAGGKSSANVGLEGTGVGAESCHCVRCVQRQSEHGMRTTEERMEKTN